MAPALEKAAAWWKTARANPLFRTGLLGAFTVVVLDQASKYWIVHIVRLPFRGRIEVSPVFDLTYVQNYGASFGMLSGGGWSRVLLSVISISVATVLAVWLGRLHRKLPAAGVAFIIGGALGNLYDRLAYGYVVDFLDFSDILFHWVFNVADAAINVGVALLLIDAFLTRDKKDGAASPGAS